MNIVLIGYRGSGKTTVGRQIAARLGWEFVDTDELLVQRAGQSIRAIFATEGEEGFRRREAAAVAEVSDRDHCVIAAGGGVVLREKNVKNLKRKGRVVWLTATAEVLWERIRGDAGTRANRPNLTANGGLEEVREVLAKRQQMYATAAEVVVDVGLLSVEEAVERVVGGVGAGPFNA